MKTRPHPDPLPKGEGAIFALCILLSGCSIVFNPDKAPSVLCPTSPASCPAVTHAIAGCSDADCKYSCADNFVDADGDLTATSTNGCELDCGVGSAPENPESLTAKVGSRAGTIEWSFPDVFGVARYRFCTSLVGALDSCDPVPECAMGTCTVTTTGHPDNARVSGKVLSIDTCGREGTMPTAATISATPLDLSSPGGWTLEKSCAGSTSSVLGGQLAIENPMGTCTSSLVAGDELWGDFTIDADLRYSGTPTDSISGGIALLSNGTGHRMGAVVLLPTN